jgi:hypothetical protein
MSPSHWWVNSGASSLAVHAHPCGGGRRTGQHILPFEVFKATKVLVGDTLWLRLVNNQLSEGHTSWLLLPRGSTFVRVLGPGDEEQLIRMQWITRLLRPSYVGPPVLAWYCSGPSEVAIHAGPSSAPEAVGRLSAWQTFAAGEHVLGGEARNQMWARVEGEEGTSGGWVCISGDRRLGRVIELESDGVDLPLGQADVAIHNVWQRHGKACPLPLRSEPRLTAPPVQGALLHPGTVKIIDRAVFNADGQMWLRLRDSGLWVIRRSATDGQVSVSGGWLLVCGPAPPLHPAHTRRRWQQPSARAHGRPRTGAALSGTAMCSRAPRCPSARRPPLTAPRHTGWGSGAA